MAQPPQLPSPGVSNIGENGSRRSIRQDVRPAQPGRFREPLKNIAGARNIDPSAPPPGTSRNVSTVVEIPMGRRTSNKTRATFRSADGRALSFQTHDEKGRAHPTNHTLCLFLAIREMRLGGDPFVVFQAFRLKIDDVDGQSVFPVPDTTPLPDLQQGFSMGEAD